MSDQSTPVPTCHVYVIAQPGSGFAKIGRTNGKLSRRLASIQAMSPVRLELRAHWHVDGGAERRLHDAFADRRQHGEWFEFGDADPVLAVTEVLRVDPVLGDNEALPMVVARSRPGRESRRPAPAAAVSRVDDLVALREAKGWSAAELARQAGLNRYRIYKIEEGEAGYSLETFMAVQRALGCSPWDLIDLPDLEANPITMFDDSVIRSRNDLLRESS